MARYIDVERYSFPTLHQKEANDYMKGWNTCLKSVLQQPTSDVEEVKHGYWKFINQATNYLEAPYGDTCHCSVCGFQIDVSETHFKRCPECGAKMDGERKNNNAE